MGEFTLTQPSSGEYREKGSVFTAIANLVSSLDEVKFMLSNLKEKYPDANHICYAYRAWEGERLDEFATDAGEPKGSAGIPILNVLKRCKLVNISIFVIRFFGGSKLGIPGLIHAYGTAAEKAIKNGTIIPWMLTERISFSFDYTLQSRVEAVLNQFDVEIVSNDYGQSVEVCLKIEKDKLPGLSQQLIDLSNGAIKVRQAT